MVPFLAYLVVVVGLLLLVVGVEGAFLLHQVAVAAVVVLVLLVEGVVEEYLWHLVVVEVAGVVLLLEVGEAVVELISRLVEVEEVGVLI